MQIELVFGKCILLLSHFGLARVNCCVGLALLLAALSRLWLIVIGRSFLRGFGKGFFLVCIDTDCICLSDCFGEHGIFSWVLSLHYGLGLNHFLGFFQISCQSWCWFLGFYLFHGENFLLLEQVGSNAVLVKRSFNEDDFVLVPGSELLQDLPRESLRQTCHARNDDYGLQPIRVCVR